MAGRGAGSSGLVEQGTRKENRCAWNNFVSGEQGAGTGGQTWEAGSICSFWQGVFFFPAKKVENIVDNTGAGDSFNAGFLDGVLKGEGHHVCMKKGIDVATFSLYGFGRSWVNKFDLMGER